METKFNEVCVAILQTNGVRIKSSDLEAHKIFKEYEKLT